VTTEEDADERLARLVDHVVELASGNLAARLAPSAASDRIDALVVGINMLAEELEWLGRDLEARVAERTRQLELAQHQLEQLALYDPLTGLANRTLLADRITRAVSRADRGGATPAVLLLDLDGFKSVNDSFGHAAGDLLLVEMAHRLRAVVRDEDTVARLGGDEFAVVLCNATDEQALEVADRIMTAITRPVVVGDATCWVGASIGVRLADRGQQPDTLLRDADTAMYAAKAGGGGGVQLYRPAMHTAVMSRVRVTEELRTALADAQLALYYQPVVDLRTGRPVGAEALVRWRHPVRGLLQPREFIAIAEDVGLVVDLGRWVLETAIAQLADWRTTGVVAAAEFTMHVNVSPVEFRSPHFAATVLGCLARHDVAATDVLLEVTESHLMGDDPQTLHAMESLRAAGVGLAIDDFGTGYSSIGYLRRLVVDTVKIDRSLVTGLDADPRQQRITAAILGVVSAFGLTCVAEGVETRADAERLAALGCPYGQGSLWGDPEPADVLAGRLSAGVTSCRGRP
jgi:diguanylate cyclase (GGDEF)-like protein